jgi:hypothetical protein
MRHKRKKVSTISGQDKIQNTKWEKIKLKKLCDSATPRLPLRSVGQVRQKEQGESLTTHNS